jgi:MinD superfamily P-loop ATPase
MVHAKLGIAEENSGKLVTLVRQEARKRAADKRLDLIVTDGPPGIGCPVIASIGGADAVLIVAEPTVSGIHDMERVAQLTDHFKVPGMVCINKYDLNPVQTQAIENSAEKRKMSVLGRIPFDPIFVESMIQGQTVFEFKKDSAVKPAIAQIWDNIKKSMNI